MTKQYVGSRFGQDLPARIAGSAVIHVDATDILPGEPMYQPLIPFYPGGVTSGEDTSTSALLSGATDEWQAYPDRLDIYCYQGDDVQIPLFFLDPDEPNMSDENEWEWKSQIRVLHHYRSTLVHEFGISSEFVPVDPLVADSVASTKVTLYLPRIHNQYAGEYEWDLASTSPYTGPIDIPRPPDIDPTTWPPTTQVKTWLFGLFHVMPRVTTTDVLPLPPGAVYVGSPAIPAVNAGPFVVGPNGRVP